MSDSTSNTTTAPPATPSSDGTMKTMVVFGSVAFVILSITYAVCWYRGKDRQRSFERHTTVHGSDEEEGTQATELPPPPPKFTDHSKRSDRNILVGGTLSLGILMWIGASIVLTMSLIDQSNYKTASVKDFQSLGSEGCLVEDTASYTFYDEKIDALNRKCVEEWEYAVTVVPTGEDFVSSPMEMDSCRTTCDRCASRLSGPKLYVGTDATRRGTYLRNSTDTFVECWAPTIPVQELSDFYPCGSQRGTTETCFLLRDPTQKLQERLDSSNIGLYSAYACYAGGFFLLLVAAWCHRKQKQRALLEKVQEKVEKEEEDSEVKQESEVSQQDNLGDRDGEKDTTSTRENPIAEETPSIQNIENGLEGRSTAEDGFPNNSAEAKPEQTA